MAGIQNVVANLMNGTPEDAAKALEAHFKGNRRNAEAEAWRLWEGMAGGSAFQRPNADTHEAQFLTHVIRCLTPQ